jgi:hypothetical protein
MRGELRHIPRFLICVHEKFEDPYAPAALYPQEDSWYSFLLEAESTPGL